MKISVITVTLDHLAGLEATFRRCDIWWDWAKRVMPQESDLRKYIVYPSLFRGIKLISHVLPKATLFSRGGGFLKFDKAKEVICKR